MIGSCIFMQTCEAQHLRLHIGPNFTNYSGVEGLGKINGGVGYMIEASIDGNLPIVKNLTVGVATEMSNIALENGAVDHWHMKSNFNATFIYLNYLPIKVNISNNLAVSLGIQYRYMHNIMTDGGIVRHNLPTNEVAYFVNSETQYFNKHEAAAIGALSYIIPLQQGLSLSLGVDYQYGLSEVFSESLDLDIKRNRYNTKIGVYYNLNFSYSD